MHKLIGRTRQAVEFLQGKKTYLAAIATFLVSLHGAHGSFLTFLNSQGGLHAELAVLAATLRAGIAKR